MSVSAVKGKEPLKEAVEPKDLKTNSKNAATVKDSKGKDVKSTDPKKSDDKTGEDTQDSKTQLKKAVSLIDSKDSSSKVKKSVAVDSKEQIQKAVSPNSSKSSAIQEIMSRAYPILEGNQFNANAMSDDKIKKAAQLLDIVTINKTSDLFADKGANSDIAKKIKALNPDTKVLQYMNMTDVWSYQDSANWLKNNNAALKGTDGQIVHPYQSRYGDKRLAADPNNAAWQNYYANHAKGLVDRGMDGIFSDNWFRSNFQGWKVNNFSQLQDGWNKVGAKAKAAMGNGALLIGNGPADSKYTSRDASMIEMRNTPNAKAFNEYLKMSDDAKKMDQANLDTIHWNMGGTDFMQKPESINKFSLPACLLTDNIFGVPQDDRALAEISKVGKIGRPEGDRYRKDDVLQRDYTGGKVYMNDTSARKTIAVPPGYKDLDGKPVTSITLDSFRGQILKSTNPTASSNYTSGVTGGSTAGTTTGTTGTTATNTATNTTTGTNTATTNTNTGTTAASAKNTNDADTTNNTNNTTTATNNNTKKAHKKCNHSKTKNNGATSQKSNNGTSGAKKVHHSNNNTATNTNAATNTGATANTNTGATAAAATTPTTATNNQDPFGFNNLFGQNQFGNNAFSPQQNPGNFMNMFFGFLMNFANYFGGYQNNNANANNATNTANTTNTANATATNTGATANAAVSPTANNAQRVNPLMGILMFFMGY